MEDLLGDSTFAEQTNELGHTVASRGQTETTGHRKDAKRESVNTGELAQTTCTLHRNKLHIFVSLTFRDYLVAAF
jgi:hypothetical protein